MQRSFLPQPPDNFLIISLNLDYIYARKQLWTAILGKQLFQVLGRKIIKEQLWLIAGCVCSLGLKIMAKQRRFIFRQRRNRQRSLARSGNVACADKTEKIRCKAA